MLVTFSDIKKKNYAQVNIMFKIFCVFITRCSILFTMVSYLFNDLMKFVPWDAGSSLG